MPSPGRPGWRSLLHRTAAAPGDRDGLDTDALAGVLAAGLRPRLVSLVTNFANPTGATVSAPRRVALARLAEHDRFLVVEDDALFRRFLGNDVAIVPGSAFR